MADRIGVMRDGAMVQVGTPAEIYERTTLRGQSSIGTVIGYFQGASAAVALATLDGMRSRFGQGEIPMVCSFAPDRYVLGMWRDWRGNPLVDLLYDGQVAVELSFLIKDGVAHRNVCDGIALSDHSTRYALPCGTAASKPVIILSTGGSATSVVTPVITLRDQNGEPVQTMTLTGTIAQNDFWRVDCGRTTITKYVSGVASAGDSLWTAGDYPIIRPADCYVEGALWATIQLSETSGVAKGNVYYRRRFL